MFRYEDGKDIEQDDFNVIVEPFLDVCEEYLETNLIPDWISFYIAKGFELNALWQTSFNIHIGSAMDMFNMDCKDFNEVKNKVCSILFNKYKLKVINDDPLDLEEVS